MDLTLGEIRTFSGIYIPRGFLPCDSRLYQVADYPLLASLLGSKYGGDGTTTFGVPNVTPLRSGNVSLITGIAYQGIWPSRGLQGIVGEIRAMPEVDLQDPFTKMWLPCDGSLLSVEDNTRLFACIRTTFGGDGTKDFRLPTLRQPLVGGGSLPCYIGATVIFPSLGCDTLQPATDRGWYDGFTGQIVQVVHTDADFLCGLVMCQGQTLNVNDFLDLYQVVGNRFGGGQMTLGVPQLPQSEVRYGISPNGFFPAPGPVQF